MPPSRTPIASERIGGSTRDASSEMARIIPTFWTAGPSALAKNRPCAFSAPAASAASPTKTTYGNITRVRSTASPPRAGASAMPGAIAVTSHGAVAMPSSAVTPRATSASVKTARSIRRTSGRDCVTKYSEKTGIIAVDKAPLGEEASQDVRDSERDEERGGHRPGAEHERDDDVTDEADHAAHERRASDGPERPDHLPFRRAHLEFVPSFGHDAARATRRPAGLSRAGRGADLTTKGAFRWRIRSRRSSASVKTSDGGSATGPCGPGCVP